MCGMSGTVHLWLKTTNIESNNFMFKSSIVLKAEPKRSETNSGLSSADEYTSPSLSVWPLCATVHIESPAQGCVSQKHR